MEPLWEFHPGTGWVAGPLVPLPPNCTGFDTEHERHAAQVRGSTGTWTGPQCWPEMPAADTANMRFAHPTLNGGGLATRDDTAYAPPPNPQPRLEQVPVLSYDDFPFHAELYNPYSAHQPSIQQPSIARQAGLPIAGLPGELSAVRSAERPRFAPHEPEAGPSRPQDLLRATTQLDALEAAGRPSSGKRRYHQFETGTATASSNAYTHVHHPPLQQASAPLAPSLRFFDPDVPIWPQRAPAEGTNDRLPEVPQRQAASLGPQGPGGAEQREAIYSDLPTVDWRRPQTPADHVAVPHSDAVSSDLSLPDPAASIGSSEPSSRRQVSERPNSSMSRLQNHLFPPFAHVSQPPLGSSPLATRQNEASFAKTSAGEDEASVLALAALRRALQSEPLLPIATTSRAGSKSASEPASRTNSLSSRSTNRTAAIRGDRRVLVESGRVNSTSQKRVASVEVVASCQRNGCSAVLARLVLRAIPDAVVAALENGAEPNEVVTLSSNKPNIRPPALLAWGSPGRRASFAPEIKVTVRADRATRRP